MTAPVRNITFLHIAGEKAIVVYNALTFTEAEEGKYNTLVLKFKEFVEGKKDLAQEHYVFNKRDQKGETFLSFFDYLKDSMIHDCIMSGIWSECTKAKLRDIVDPDINTIIRICKNDKNTHTRQRKPSHTPSKAYTSTPAKKECLHVGNE